MKDTGNYYIILVSPYLATQLSPHLDNEPGKK